MNISCPKSLRRPTQPHTVICLPASSKRGSPHQSVRAKPIELSCFVIAHISLTSKKSIGKTRENPAAAEKIWDEIANGLQKIFDKTMQDLEAAFAEHGDEIEDTLRDYAD
jgi:hypothetical protein